jgi:hypothetical protein
MEQECPPLAACAKRSFRFARSLLWKSIAINLCELSPPSQIGWFSLHSGVLTDLL